MTTATLRPARLTGLMTPSASLLTARVVRQTWLAEGVLELRWRSLQGGPLPEWDPGAHLTLQLANGVRRDYSLWGDLDDWQEGTIAVLRGPARKSCTRRRCTSVLALVLAFRAPGQRQRPWTPDEGAGAPLHVLGRHGEAQVRELAQQTREDLL